MSLLYVHIYIYIYIYNGIDGIMSVFDIYVTCLRKELDHSKQAFCELPIKWIIDIHKDTQVHLGHINIIIVFPGINYFS